MCGCSCLSTCIALHPCAHICTGDGLVCSVHDGLVAAHAECLTQPYMPYMSALYVAHQVMGSFAPYMMASLLMAGVCILLDGVLQVWCVAYKADI